MLCTRAIFILKEKLLTRYLMPESIFIYSCKTRSTYFRILDLFLSGDIMLDRSILQYSPILN